MVKYEVALARVKETGRTVISNFPKCVPGVYRLEIGDSVVFKFFASLGDSVILSDIAGCVSATLLVTPPSDQSHCDPSVTSVEWAPAIPGPYTVSIAGDAGGNRENYFFSPESTIVVNPVVPQVNHSSNIRMLSAMPRRLGPISGWPGELETLLLNGAYNAVHFTPCQPSGPSNSAYSIADVLDVDPTLFGAGSACTTPAARWEELGRVLKSVEPKILAVTDVVLNHASSGDSWALSEPEATYCVGECPYFRAAAELDEALAEFGTLHPEYLRMDSESELIQCMHGIRVVLEKFNFSAFFQLDVASTVDLYLSSLFEADDVGVAKPSTIPPVWQALSQAGTSRTASIVLDLRAQCPDIASAWREVHAVQAALEEASAQCFYSALSALEATIRYERLQERKTDGSLVPRYFSRLANGDWAANNGWVMNWPAGLDFAAPGHHLVYMRRHVVAWGDCLKLRYPSTLDSEGRIWDVMEQYCGLIAKTFDGVRLDNCHSTPVHVMRRLVGHMRKVNPNLVVIAELFTGEAGNDLVYEATVGLDLLVREAMQISSPGELVGKLWNVANRGCGFVEADSIETELKELVPTKASAILYDCTHDNSTPATKFGTFTDALPLAVAACSNASAVGSTVGFDSLRAHLPSVVVPPGTGGGDSSDSACIPGPGLVWLNGHENAKHVEVFGEWDGWASGVSLQRSNTGCWVIGKADEKWLNPRLQHSACQFKFLVDKHEWCINDELAVTAATGAYRNNLSGGAGTFCELKAEVLRLHASLSDMGYSEFFAKSHPSGILEIERMHPKTGQACILLVNFAAFSQPIDQASHVSVIDLESDIDSKVTVVSVEPRTDSPEPNPEHFKCHIAYHDIAPFLQSPDSTSDNEFASRRLCLRDLPRSSFVTIRTSPIAALNALDRALSALPIDKIRSAYDYSYMLFRCDAEEAVFNVPGGGNLVFAGLYGIWSEISALLPDQAKFLSSPIAASIREGDWLFDFCVSRLAPLFPSLFNILHNEVRPAYSVLPSGLKPKAFVRIFINSLLHPILVQWRKQFSPAPTRPGSLVDNLALATLQFTSGRTVAAGLPHFASGYMRCWGRDTFIAFTGLFLVTNRFDEAKACLLAFASVVRQGLIPNLFDDGNSPRYNSRDACWCFLNSACNYLKWTGDIELMDTSVSLKFADRAFSSSWKHQPSGSVVTFRDVVVGILMSHWCGIDFVEENAGPQIDEHMKPKGFHVTASVTRRNGLVVGGNPYNCGTWMDKMGSSERTGNRGIPATSRYGANIEINGLALRVLAFFSSGSAFFDLGIPELVQWKQTLMQSFDSAFWNPESGIYNDTVEGDPKGAKLRPNGVFALSVIPIEAVDKAHAIAYLSTCEQSLMGPLGMRTLPGTDPDYKGWYDNADDSCGYNYHNGPEWVWLFGYFLIACRRFGVMTESAMLHAVEAHATHVRSSKWRSLPELTNMNGAECQFSCPSQAWSVCCLLEAINCSKKFK